MQNMVDLMEFRPDGILNTGIIEPGESFSKRFDNTTPSIPYFCIRHPEERGTIIIYDKFEDEMTMKESIDHLKKVFTFDNIKHQQEEDIASRLSRYEDPVVREGYYHHELETIHNRILTIVFWDIIYLEPCFEFIDHLAFFINAYSGRKSESEVMAECLMQYGFHFFALRRYSSFCFSSPSVIVPFSSMRMILNRSCFIIVHIASGLTGLPVMRLQISLASGSFLNGCSFIQSRT